MLFIACDHAGLEAKNDLIRRLIKWGVPFTDLGVNSSNSVNYALKAKELSCALGKGTQEDFGLLICGTGIGMSIAANRFNHLRAALCYDVRSARLARQHNNANVLILKGRHYSKLKNARILKTFLSTEFEGGRHLERVETLKTLNLD